MSKEIKYTPTPELFTIPPFTESLKTSKAIIDNEKQTWNRLIDHLRLKSSKIIALRGAGSWNGMDPKEVDELIRSRLIPRLEGQLQQLGLVAVLFDGDYDDLQKPDLGYVAGRLLEHFGNGKQRMIFIVAQKESWHPDELPGLNLKNAQGAEYVTYLFPDDTYPGDHSSFTQAEELVKSRKYEQWYIGASGKIAESQLLDYNTKVPAEEKRKAVLFRVKNNGALDAEIQEKIAQAQAAGDDKKVANLTQRAEQRQRQYGVHWNNEGQPDVQPEDFPNLVFEFVSSGLLQVEE